MDKAEKQEMVALLHRVIGKLNGNHPESGIDELAGLCNRLQSEIKGSDATSQHFTDQELARFVSVITKCYGCKEDIIDAMGGKLGVRDNHGDHRESAERGDGELKRE